MRISNISHATEMLLWERSEKYGFSQLFPTLQQQQQQSSAKQITRENCCNDDGQQYSKFMK